MPALEGGRPVRPKEDFLVFGRPVVGDPEIRALTDCIRRCWIGTGPKVAEFERAFARFKGAPFAVAVNSGTAALHLAMLVAGIGRGDEVVTTAMTFCSTLNAIVHAGAVPVLADCDKRTFNITAGAIRERLTARTRAILVVHMCGRSCDMGPILDLARERGLLLVEDCAHAIETTYHGQAAGLMGDMGCFSFYATKNLTTAEGGMILTQDEELANTLKSLALHGMDKDAWQRFSDAGYRHYAVTRSGFKYNMTDLQGAMGLEQLKRLEALATRRSRIWKLYDEAFADLPCTLPAPEEKDTRHAHHLYTPLLDLERLRVSRDRVLDALTAENIGAGVHYLPVHLHPYYSQTYGWKHGDFEHAEAIGERTLSLPLSGGLNEVDVDNVIQAFRRILLFYAKG